MYMNRKYIVKNIMVDPVVWERFKLQAERREISASQLIRKIMIKYVERMEEKQREPGTPAFE